MEDARKREIVHLIGRDPLRALATLGEMASQSTEQDPDLHYLRGIAHFRLKNFASAEEAMRATISLNATDAEAFYYLGLTAERQGQTGDAVKAYRAAAALKPELVEAREKLDLLDPESMLGSPPPPRRTLRGQGRDDPGSSLMLPYFDTDQETDDFKTRTQKREEIEARARDRAQVVGLPRWAKAMSVIFAIFILTILVWVFYTYATRNDSSEQRQKDYIKQQQCDLAKKAHIPLPPGC